MSVKNVHKIGFFSAISICVGSMVGIGIFLKNASVGTNVQGNGISWLLTWIISGLIALLVAIHFGKISRIESKNGTSGLTIWTDYVAQNKNKWFRKIVSFNYGFFYNAILTVALSFFTTELLIDFLQAINSNVKLEVWHHVLISIVFLLFFVFLNHFSFKISGCVSLITTVLKFIPLFITVIVGIVFANNHTMNGTNGFIQQISFLDSFRGIMLSIPSVLFAFDAFLGVGALSKQIKNGEKNISKIIVFSMIFVTVIYLLICVASIFHFDKDGTFVLHVLHDSLPKNAQKAITIFVAFFLFVSAFGTSNAIIGVSVKEFENMCANTRVLFADRLVKKFGLKNAGLILKLCIISWWACIMFIPAVILKTDSIIDGFSNLVVVYFFLVYIFVIFLFWKNIYLNDRSFQNESKKAYTVLVFASIAGVVLALGANFFFVIFDAITDPWSPSSWGLLLVNKPKEGFFVNKLVVLITYLVVTPIFFLIPLLNFKLIEKIEKIKYV